MDLSTMRCIRRVTLAFACSLFAVIAFAQARPAVQPEISPIVGQPGKDVIWLPTAQTLVNRMLDMAELTANDIHYDLGSGDGRTVIAAAKRGATTIGIEYDPALVKLSRRNADKEGVTGRATFVHGDIFETDFSKATVITLFLLPELNAKLRPKILAMKPGTRVVSNSFTMGDWKADQIQRAAGGCASFCTAYLWIVPATVDGVWKSGKDEIKFKQEFQIVHGSVGRRDKLAPVLDGRMRGNKISFASGAAQYRGRVDGNYIMGTVTTGGKTAPWIANRINH